MSWHMFHMIDENYMWNLAEGANQWHQAPRHHAAARRHCSAAQHTKGAPALSPLLVTTTLRLPPLCARCSRSLAIDGHHHPPPPAAVSVLAQPDALPGAQAQP